MTAKIIFYIILGNPSMLVSMWNLSDELLQMDTPQ